jgi:hypothetical protein
MIIGLTDSEFILSSNSTKSIFIYIKKLLLSICNRCETGLFWIVDKLKLERKKFLQSPRGLILKIFFSHAIF